MGEWEEAVEHVLWMGENYEYEIMMLGEEWSTSERMNCATAIRVVWDMTHPHRRHCTHSAGEE